jgi:hypothetical protein
MELGLIIQPPQIKSFLAILAVSLLIAVFDSVRRRQRRLSFAAACAVAPRVQFSSIPDALPPPVATRAAAVAVAVAAVEAKVVAAVPAAEPLPLTVPRIMEPVLPHAGLLPLPKPNPQYPRKAEPMKTYIVSWKEAASA